MVTFSAIFHTFVITVAITMTDCHVKERTCSYPMHLINTD